MRSPDARPPSLSCETAVNTCPHFPLFSSHLLQITALSCFELCPVLQMSNQHANITHFCLLLMTFSRHHFTWKHGIRFQYPILHNTLKSHCLPSREIYYTSYLYSVLITSERSLSRGALDIFLWSVFQSRVLAFGWQWWPHYLSYVFDFWFPFVLFLFWGTQLSLSICPVVWEDIRFRKS